MKTKERPKTKQKISTAIKTTKQKVNFRKPKPRVDRMVSTKPETQAKHAKQRASALAKKPRKIKNAAYYVDPKDLYDRIKAFYKSGSEMYDPDLGVMVTKIAYRLAFAPNFINYSYREEMCGDAICKMLSALKNKKFKINMGYNPFSYFTKIAFNSFCSRIKKEKKNHATLEAYQKEVYDNLLVRGHVSNKTEYSEAEF